MARYDRIAPLTAPTRPDAFPGWPVLRDIETNDRDVEHARRARLRFLALRPVRRLLDRGAEGVGRDSYLAQIEAVREELGYLPARDVERGRLARFLHNIEDRVPARVISATLEMADACATAGQLHAAEEYGLTALGLAAAQHEPRLEALANVTLARVHRTRCDWQQLDEFAICACMLAEGNADLLMVAMARGEQALAAAARGQVSTARQIMGEVLKRARAENDTQAEAVAQARWCACEIAAGNATAGLDYGWAGFRQLEDLRERALLLEQIGIAFSTLGLHKAAERCFTIVAQRGVDPALRARARAGQAVEAAASDQAQTFRDRRTALLNDSAEWIADPRVSAFVQLELGRGCVIVGDIDYGREHIREAIGAARRYMLDDVITSAEVVLSALEQNTTQHLITATGTGPTADAARRIADQIEALNDLPAVAT